MMRTDVPAKPRNAVKWVIDSTRVGADERAAAKSKQYGDPEPYTLNIITIW
jgi:hypothetical protein